MPGDKLVPFWPGLMARLRLAYLAFRFPEAMREAMNNRLERDRRTKGGTDG